MALSKTVIKLIVFNTYFYFYLKSRAWIWVTFLLCRIITSTDCMTTLTFPGDAIMYSIHSSSVRSLSTSGGCAIMGSSVTLGKPYLKITLYII